MADGEKGNSTDQILQAFDALSNLYQARAGAANRRTTSLALPGAGDNAAVEEARPRPHQRRRLSSPRSPFWSKPNKLDKNENYDVDGVEDGDDAAFIVIVRGRGLPLMLPLDKKEVDDYDEEDDDSTNSTATTEADGEKKGTMSWGPIRAASHIGMRRMGCLFSFEVVAAQGLPPSLNGLRVAVTVRRKETRDDAVQTKPARVQLGVAHFDEALYMRCHLYDTGGGTTGKPLSFEPQLFLVYLVAIHAPELDFGRSTVDLSLFAKEFTDKCQLGECIRQWDMVFPLDQRAKGGELVVNLAIQSIDDGGAGSYSQRKLRMHSLSNMLTPKMTRTNSPKMGLSAPVLRGIDSFVLDEPEFELTPVVEVEEEQQQKEPECEPADELTLVAEVEEEQQKETEREPANEPTPMAEVKEEEQQKQESERELADEPTPVVEVKQEEQQKQEPERELADEPTPVAEVKAEEQQKQEPECELVDEPTPVVEVKEEEQQKQKPERELADEPTPVAEVKAGEQQKQEPECELVDEPTPVVEVKEEEQQNEPERELADEPTPVAEVKDEDQEPEREPVDEPTPEAEVKEEEKQSEPEHEPADECTPMAEVKEEEQQKKAECDPADERIAMAEVKEEEQKKKEPEREAADEPTPQADVKEEQQGEPEREPADEPIPEAKVQEVEQQKKEPERDPEVAKQDDDSELPEFNAIDRGVEGQEVESELKEEVEANKGFEEEDEASLFTGDEVAMANGLQEKSVESTMPNGMSEVVVDAVELMDVEAGRQEEITRESLQVPEQREDKDTAAKPSRRPRFKWRTVALLVPIAVTFSKTLGAGR